MLSRSKAKRKAHMEKTRTLLTEKIRESLVSVLPIIIIVTLLCLFLVPMQPTLLLTFLIGALMIVVGMGLFSLGAERSMTIIGNKIGTALTKTNKLPVILLVAFALGVAVTVAEPDLQVLADTVPNIDKSVLLAAVGIFLLFQLCVFRMNTRSFGKIFVGIVYTYVGLVLFLTGVNVGFSNLGAELGAALVSSSLEWLLIPLAALLGWFIISAEPAVAVLEKQIEEVSAGAIPGKAIKVSLSVAIALAMGLAMLRVVTGVSLLWFLVPGYTVALGLSFFVPDIYTAIAFDSGGVASGPMTATFMLQFMMGVSIALGGNVLTDAFGIVAMVAMMPLLSIQVVGFYYQRKARKVTRELESYGDCDIIELWEEPA